MRTLYRNIEVTEHDSWEIVLNYENPKGTPFDFTGYDPILKVVNPFDEEEIIDLSDNVTLSTDSSGNVNISITDTKDAAAGRFKYDLVIDDGTKQHTIFFGDFKIKPRHSEEE